MRLFFAIITVVVLNHSAWANEPFAEPSFWLAHGYQEVPKPQLQALRTQTTPWAPHSLAWPIAFQDSAHSIGNSMLEFQSYGDGPYYHGGLDLRVSARAIVSTPVAGRIEAGHYGYSNKPDGSMDKYWTPWPGSGDPTYFEVAVVTDDNYRFEFHHMDENHLSPAVMDILRKGGGRVVAGAALGATIAWPDGVYHHTHYNIITPAGVRSNPEFYSPLLADHKAPEVSAVLASYASGRVVDFARGELSGRPDFFAVAVIDHQDNNVYDHPPVLASLEFADGKKFVWDFRERLTGPDGLFPSIWSFFVESISGPRGEEYRTEGGYGEGVSVVRIPVPAGASGAFVLKVADQAGNETKLSGTIKP